MQGDIGARIAFLTEKIINGDSLSAFEKDELEEFLSSDPRIRSAFEARIDPAVLDELTKVYLRANSILGVKYEEIRTRRRTIRLNRWKLYAVSAAVFLIVVSGLILLIPKPNQNGSPQVSQTSDVQPGGNKAILTLADGSAILLDSAKNGELATQGQNKIVKLNNGQINYTALRQGPAIGFNTISTPRGGSYQVMLPDGSKVWLNAESSIHFPISFNDNSREVAITGEVYFEIARDPRRPFNVSAQAFIVSVLGTSFNIRSYKEDMARITLTSGAVRVNKGGEQIKLGPGDQVVAGSNLTLTHDADIEQVTAWTENIFLFTHASIEEVMTEFSRWYGVEVRYEGEKSNKKISGIFRRDVVASKNLEILKANGYKFRIEAGTIILLPG